MAREFDIFGGINSELLNKILEYTQTYFPNTVDDISNKIADATYRYWAAEAEMASSWGQRYASTLVFEPASEGRPAVVYADEQHENMLFVYMMEKGVKSWSIKDALLEGKAAARNKAKHGRVFVNVPFRHRTPGKIKPTSMFAGVLEEEAHNLAMGGEGTKHLTGNLAGLKRYSRGVHSGFFTFRTVTPKSQWRDHPGKMPTPVFYKVLQKVEQLIESAVTGWMKKFEIQLKTRFGKE